MAATTTTTTAAPGPKVTFGFLPGKHVIGPIPEHGEPMPMVCRMPRSRSPYPKRLAEPQAGRAASHSQNTNHNHNRNHRTAVSVLKRCRRAARSIPLAEAVDRKARPDTDSEWDSELDGSDSELDGGVMGGVPVGVYRAGLRAQWARECASYSGRPRRRSSRSRNHCSHVDNREIDPATAAVIQQVRESFARHKAWHVQNKSAQSAAPAIAVTTAATATATATATASTPLPRSTATPETATPEREQQKRRHRWTWLRKIKDKKAAKRNNKTTTASAQATATVKAEAQPAQPTRPARPASPVLARLTASPVPTPRPGPMRQYVNQQLGGGVLVHSWIGWRDCYDRYPPV